MSRMKEKPGYFAKRAMGRREFTQVALSMVPWLLPRCARGGPLDENIESRPHDSMASDVLERIIASEMDSGMARYECYMTERKKRLFKLIPIGSTVLEVGLGTGPNFAYFPQGTSVIGLEPNRYMWRYARRRAKESGINLQLLQAHGENIPLPDSSVDVVVTTLTLCTVSDVTSTLQEVVRVLRPGGIYIFVEHVVASTERPVLRVAQKMLTPIQELVAGGCHLDRDTGQVIFQTLSQSMSCIYVESFDARIGGNEDALSLIRPHIAGYGQKKTDI